MTSMTASALRPLRSKWMRWRSPLPFLVGPGTAALQLGSHSGMRLASERSSNTSSMGTPTKPEYVREIGRMGIIWAVEGGEGWWRAPVGDPVLFLQGLLAGGYVSKFSLPRGAVAQLGERLDRTQEVRGSSPLSSTAPWHDAQ